MNESGGHSAQLRSALILMYPDEMTPRAKRLFERIADQWDEDAMNFLNEMKYGKREGGAA